MSILVPVLGRPQRVRPLLDSLVGTTGSHEVAVVFLASPGDTEQHAAVRAAGHKPVVMAWEAGDGDYARKMNLGYRQATSEFVFLAADDVVFRAHWLDYALQAHAAHNACVVGTNDLGNQRVMRGQHSTHTLVHRDYVGCCFPRGTEDPADADGVLLHEGYTHNFCNPGEAPIWMADCSFKALGDVQVGDQVVGWDYGNDVPAVGSPRRRFVFAHVLAVTRRRSPLVEVEMTSGRTLRCTPDHRWLNSAWSPSSRSAPQWIHPKVGRTLLHVVSQPEPLDPEKTRAAGWLAGIYDGEGSGIYIATQSADHNPVVIEEIARVLDLLEVPHTFTIRKSGVAEFVMTGGRQGYLDFLLRVGPIRRKSLEAHIVGWRGRYESRTDRAAVGGRRFGRQDKIVAVRTCGEDEVLSLTTTSGNYIAWGYASRNCDDEMVRTAQARGTFVPAPRAVVEHLHPDWGKGEMDATYRKGKEHFNDDRQLYERRQRFWQ